MARAIVRYSCNTNAAGKYQAEKARKSMRDVLEAANFGKTGQAGQGTASWELAGASTAVIGAALSELMQVVQALPPGVLDHLWLYCDE
jgi:hypothetical protein